MFFAGSLFSKIYDLLILVAHVLDRFICIYSFCLFIFDRDIRNDIENGFLG